MSKDMELALEQVRRAAQREATGNITITTFLGMTPKQITFLRRSWEAHNPGMRFEDFVAP